MAFVFLMISCDKLAFLVVSRLKSWETCVSDVLPLK